MMKRRKFGPRLIGAAIGAGLVGTSVSGPVAAQPARAGRKNTLMHVGGDYHSVVGSGITSKENLEYNLRYGVKHLTVQVGKRTPDGGWDLNELKRMKDDCDRYGVKLEAIRMDANYITLRKGPEHDRAFDNIKGLRNPKPMSIRRR